MKRLLAILFAAVVFLPVTTLAQEPLPLPSEAPLPVPSSEPTSTVGPKGAKADILARRWNNRLRMPSRDQMFAQGWHIDPAAQIAC